VLRQVFVAVIVILALQMIYKAIMGDFANVAPG
jgi:hypothetical protein